MASANLTRRSILCTACALPTLAACGSDESPGTADATPTAKSTQDAPGPPVEPSDKPTRSKTSEAKVSDTASTGGSPGRTTADAEPTPKESESSKDPGSTPSPDNPDPGPPPGALVRASAVPVGGGVVLAGKGIVVTQPSQGTFRGFTSVCTHAGCSVGSVSNREIICPCHGSRFSIVDGSVTHGPTRNGLAAIAVKLVDGYVVRV